MPVAIGKIRQVPLREVWPNEAADFTRWLAKPENIAQLGDAVGIEFDPEQIETEHSVGPFSLDIYAKDVDGNVVNIENQLEDTDHDHLGKLITYAAGTEASACIWVVKHARDEHKSAVEWLNEHTDRGIGFILVEISAIAIGASEAAPLFSVVESPNDWARAVKAADGMSDNDKLRLSYWQQFADAARTDDAFSKAFSLQKPQPWGWMNFSSGDRRFHYEASIIPTKNKICVSMYVEDDKGFGAMLAANAAAFESALGISATVMDSAKKASGLRFYRSGCPTKSSQEKWPSYFEWQRSAILKLKGVYDSLNA